MTKVRIRKATARDLPAINRVYNHYVLHSTCTYQETPRIAPEAREWFSDHDRFHPITVATLDGVVVGWASLSRFHARSAYRFTVENSVYIDKDHHRQGIGSLLLADLLNRARALGHRAVIAGISADQRASIAIHARFGFKKVGHLRKVGFKFGRWLDAVYMELLLDQ